LAWRLLAVVVALADPVPTEIDKLGSPRATLCTR
jgi:hypothetical protein